MSFTESKVVVVGRLGADPELRTLGSGQAVLDIRLCANVYRGKDKDETPVWYKVSVWEKYAEALAKSGMSKGDTVYVAGDLILDEYTTKDGEVRTQLVILNASVIPMSRPGGGQREQPRQESRGGRSGSSGGGRSAGSPFGGSPSDDEIPY